MRYLFLICGWSLSFFSNAQLVNQIFDQIVVEERFTSLDKKWPQIFNTENLAISQPGGYEIRRNNEQSGNYIFPKLEKSFKSFELIYSLKFHKTAANEASAGVLIMANKEAGTGILVETNKLRGYRISKTLANGESFYYTNEEEDGWIKNKKALGKKTNIIKIRTHEKKYDFYVNDEFIYSFTEFEYNGGNIGIYIGPKSHCFLESFVIFTSSTTLVSDTTIADNNQVSSLKTQLRIKQTEIDRLKAMQVNDQQNIQEIKSLESKIDLLNNTISSQKLDIDSLEKNNKSLNYFKQSVTLNNGDISIESLYSKLEQLRQDSISLEEKISRSNDVNIQQSEEIKRLEKQYTELKFLKTSEINFLIRQIDFLTQNLKSDSMYIIDTINKGQGFLNFPKSTPEYKNLEIKKA